MYSMHLLILAAHVMLRVTITPVIGHPIHLTGMFPDMDACTLAGHEAQAAEPDDDVFYTCNPRWSA